MPHQFSLLQDTHTAPFQSGANKSDVWFSQACIGVDEAGRGCLAGPVVAGAVLLPQGMDIPALLPGLTDSKKLSARQRGILDQAVRRHALAWCLGLSWPWEIDKINILNATFRAMSRAVTKLRLPCPLGDCQLFIDGNHPIRAEHWQRVSSAPLPRQQAIIGGDALVPAISAASIVAKVFRDKLMSALDIHYPGYEFAIHKGYGTKAHMEALLRKGACRIHRHSFRGVRPVESHLPLP